MKRIEQSDRKVFIVHYDGWVSTPKGRRWVPHNASAKPASIKDAYLAVDTGVKGAGSHAMVRHAPAHWINHASGGVGAPPPGTTSDAVLLHELDHAANNTEGINRRQWSTNAHAWNQRWRNFEEYDATAKDNGYRLEVGLPTRANYGARPP